MSFKKAAPLCRILRLSPFLRKKHRNLNSLPDVQERPVTHQFTREADRTTEISFRDLQKLFWDQEESLTPKSEASEVLAKQEMHKDTRLPFRGKYRVHNLTMPVLEDE